MVSRGFLAFLCIAVAACDQSAFDAFKARYGKVYASPEEEAARAAVFAANTAALHTSKDGATLGVTKFSDLTPDEFSARFLGLRPSTRGAHQPKWDGTCYACRRFPAHAQRDAAARVFAVLHEKREEAQKPEVLAEEIDRLISLAKKVISISYFQQ